jgi:long-subunit fatty acid transport protein
LAALLILAAPAWGQIPINSAPNAVGSGARALGMGGAFIAVADDATAASWNPGGLTQLERPEISLVYSWKWFSEEFESKYHPELNGDFDLDIDDINYFSIAYPFPQTIAGRNFVLSLNYQHKFDFDRQLDVRYNDIVAAAQGLIAGIKTTVDYEQEGSLSALSPAFGFELTDSLSMGVVMNIWDQSLISSNEWKIRTDFKTQVAFNGRLSSYTWGDIEQRYDDFEGTNYTFGLLWHPAERWGVGAVYHSGFTADVEYSRFFRTRGSQRSFAVDREDRKIEFPRAYGLGLSYRFPNDQLTLSLDVTRRDWDEFVEIKGFDNKGDRISPITGIPKNDSYNEPTYTVRLGGEYVFIDPELPRPKYLPSLRAGVYYDPEPASGRKDAWYGLDRGNGTPDDFYGLTLGAGVLIMDRVNIDAAYEYRWGDDVRKDTFGFPATHADVDQHNLYLSTVVYF